jgi:nonribosomal peptide synthetase DhbF
VRCDLVVTLTERATGDGAPAGIRCGIGYSTDVFDRATAERLAGQLVLVLEAVVADPDVRVAQIEMVAGDQRRQLLAEWNGHRSAGVDQCVHGLFEEQAARVPEATALLADDQCLTYAQLNARANRLAEHLRQRGMRPGILVGVRLEWSPDLIVGLLAVLKAGGGHLSLDPELPAGPLLAQAGAELLITRRALTASPSSGGAATPMPGPPSLLGTSPSRPAQRSPGRSFRYSQSWHGPA